MRKSHVWALAISSCLAAGCGGGSTRHPPNKDAPKVGPHDGTAFALPDGLGYVEVLNEPKVVDRDKGSTSIVAYFFRPDVKTPLEPLPTDVKIRLDVARKGQQTADLTSSPNSGDPSGGARFVTAPGGYNLEELRGELTATASSKPVKVTIAGLR